MLGQLMAAMIKQRTLGMVLQAYEKEQEKRQQNTCFIIVERSDGKEVDE